MDVIEIGILAMSAIIIGIIIMGFFIDWDYMRVYNGIKSGFFGKDKTAYERIGQEELPKVLFNFWELCSKRENELTKPVYIEGEGTISKESFFNIMKEGSFCGVIQSKEYGCGEKETFKEFSSLTLPAVAQIRCVNGSLYLK